MHQDSTAITSSISHYWISESVEVLNRKTRLINSIYNGITHSMFNRIPFAYGVCYEMDFQSLKLSERIPEGDVSNRVLINCCTDTHRAIGSQCTILHLIDQNSFKHDHDTLTHQLEEIAYDYDLVYESLATAEISSLIHYRRLPP